MVIKWLWVVLLLTYTGVGRGQSVIDGSILDGGQLPAQWNSEDQSVPENERVCINFCSAEDLLGIGLDPYQAANLLFYRQESGLLYGPFELRVIKGFDAGTIERVQAKMDFGLNPPPRARWQLLRRQSLRHRYRTFCAFRSPGPEPALSPNQNIADFRWQNQWKSQWGRHLEFALNAEQDPGEYWTSQGFDHYQGYLQIKDIGPITQAVLGNFHLQQGHGLGLWTGYRNFLSQEPRDIYLRDKRIRAYAGSNEWQALRGLALNSSWQQWSGNLFFSNRKRDVNGWKEEGSFSSFDQSGLHNSAGQIESAQKVREKTWGGQIKWQGTRAALGLAGHHLRLNQELQEDRGPFGYTGKSQSNLELSGSWRLPEILFLGALSVDQGQHSAQRVGLVYRSVSSLRLSLLVERWDLAYHSILTEHRGNKGGLRSQLFIHWWPLASLEVKQLWRFQRDAWLPSGWSEAQWRLDHLLRWNSLEKNSWSLRLKQNLRWEQEQWLSRWHLKVSWPSWASFQAHSHLYYVHDMQNEAWAFLQDLEWQANADLRIIARIALAHVPDPALRIYAYAHDLSYRFMVPAFYRPQQGFYLLLKWQWMPKLRYEFKIGRNQSLPFEQDRQGPVTETPDIWQLSLQIIGKI